MLAFKRMGFYDIGVCITILAPLPARDLSWSYKQICNFGRDPFDFLLRVDASTSL